MTTSRILTGLVLCAAVATGCGEDAADDQAAKPVRRHRRTAGRSSSRTRTTCAARTWPTRWRRPDMTRRVQYALADDAKIPGLNRLRASQSIFFAITEVCKDKPGGVQARPPAISGVRNGEYLADLGSP